MGSMFYGIFKIIFDFYKAKRSNSLYGFYVLWHFLIIIGYIQKYVFVKKNIFIED